MVKASVLILFVSAVTLTPLSVDAAQSSDDLVRYRDTEFFRAWEVALEPKRTFEEAKAGA
jgi:hypothetical protein